MDKWICDGVEFKVGDTVLIKKAVSTRAGDGMGEGVQWENGRVTKMYQYIGSTFTINHISESGAWGDYGFPLSSLEKVDAGVGGE